MGGGARLKGIDTILKAVTYLDDNYCVLIVGNIKLSYFSVKNILMHLGVLEGEPHRHGSGPKPVDPVIYEDAPVAGCWYPAYQPGETFKKGDVLGTIKDYFGNTLYTCIAKQGGIILYETISLCIMKDSPMVAYGFWDEEKDGKIERDCLVCGQNEKGSGAEHEHHRAYLHNEQK